ncbi:hypothetical protein COCC4DRAFT_123589 [Bipolaris maydis ATCC 48331]|uniref:SET domain-containing protein n=1 Tax=Cochliobolus heterostrophus (strain C4 / ATCC 48331 / race T) TaxID=665024 RepID=N4XYS8_COCH4|nr:uncharacterized protein COCC4DRAFT_123589 [Bipolaris maydis ATCC 48331]ENI10357.1 hypothetical protein COCC4DRAFT_123589 [Bipolaris maydis ATCC 48331]KAJ5030259.1 hypothetical protein J3E73DRAFT_404531 [Bipolaris maydis]KAJ6274903.1 hypothetical protein PSV08DRAFT_384580 [Bipolaris maydis]KAJ6285811.1 hypothetical protein J3E71DRAFT_374124 [Bipolaris maydis]
MNSLRVFFALSGVCAAATTSHIHGPSSPQCANLLPHFAAQMQTPLRSQQCLHGDTDAKPPPVISLFQHPIWSHEPMCVTGKEKIYCTHTTADSGSGHGLSIIATPSAAGKLSSKFSKQKKKVRRSEDGLQVRSIPGKGKGLFTTKLIKKGETILLDPARIIASSHFPARVSHAQGRSLFNSALARLPEEDHKMVAALDQSLGGSPIEDVMKTNSFACRLDDGNVDKAYICLFPSVSRINHACQPNALARFVPKTLSMQVKAKRDIAAGEEINISYGRVDLTREERQELYKDGWNFECTCSLCTAPHGETKASDDRRIRFARLKQRLRNLTAETYDAKQVVEWEKEVMAIAQSEGLEVLLAEDYERLAYVYAGHGMATEARRWAEKAKQNLLDWAVEDSRRDEDVRRLDETLAELG